MNIACDDYGIERLQLIKRAHKHINDCVMSPFIMLNLISAGHVTSYPLYVLI